MLYNLQQTKENFKKLVKILAKQPLLNEKRDVVDLCCDIWVELRKMEELVKK
jgi:hypothetical protein